VTAQDVLTAGPAAGFEGGIDAVLAELVDVLSAARPVPLSSSVMVNRDELLALVDEVAARLPEEVRAARRLLRERDEHLATVRREADDILDAARERAERMVSRTELVRMAQATARRAVDTAEAESRRLRHEAEDWCDGQLATLEAALDGAMRSVRAGRGRLNGPPPPELDAAEGDDLLVFDQDSEEP
jgi:cell division septum initiation protein DivIVA